MATHNYNFCNIDGSHQKPPGFLEKLLSYIVLNLICFLCYAIFCIHVPKLKFHLSIYLKQ